MNEDHYLSLDYMTFEEFVHEMRSLINKETVQLHFYKSMYLDVNTPESDRDRAKMYIDGCAQSITENVRILKEAEENIDYCVFARDVDGYPVSKQVPPAVKKKIEQKMKEVRSLYV